MNRLARKLPPCGICRGQAFSLAYTGPTEGVPLCDDPYCSETARALVRNNREETAARRQIEDSGILTHPDTDPALTAAFRRGLITAREFMFKHTTREDI